MINIAILFFDGMEELDAVGPWEVFSWAAQEETPDPPLHAFTLSRDGKPVICNKGLAMTPHHSFDTASRIDVLIVPGGSGSTAVIQDRAMLDWVAETAAGCQWIASVCTGSRILVKSGVARGKRITTYHGAVPELRGWNEATVLDDVRFVRDGNVVSSAGVSAGIDMSLWLVGALCGPAFARRVQQGIEYFPAPPYTHEA